MLHTHTPANSVFQLYLSPVFRFSLRNKEGSYEIPIPEIIIIIVISLSQLQSSHFTLRCAKAINRPTKLSLKMFEITLSWYSDYQCIGLLCWLVYACILLFFSPSSWVFVSLLKSLQLETLEYLGFAFFFVPSLGLSSLPLLSVEKFRIPQGICSQPSLGSRSYREGSCSLRQLQPAFSGIQKFQRGSVFLRTSLASLPGALEGLSLCKLLSMKGKYAKWVCAGLPCVFYFSVRLTQLWLKFDL